MRVNLISEVVFFISVVVNIGGGGYEFYENLIKVENFFLESECI